jgi:hypothetical protein
MSLLLGAATAVLAIAPAPAPVMAQDTPAMSADHRDWTLRQREDWLHQKIDASRDAGALSHEEYDRVNDALHDIRSHEDTLRDHQSGQLTPAQTEMLETRLDRVANRIHLANATALALPW